MDRITAMQVFSEVATSGSFSATAEKLEMSRAMVTRYINALEKWLGSRLLQRSTRKVTLTDAGEQCLRRSQQILTIVENVEDETNKSGVELRGQLRLTCSTSLSYAELAAILVDFLALHPFLKIDLNVSENAINLVESRIDLAIRISNDPDPMLIGRPLAQCNSVLVASPAYLAKHKPLKIPQELSQHLCLTYVNLGKSVWSLSRGETSVKVSVASHFSANEAVTLLQACIAGGGIATQPTYLVNSLVNSGELQVVLPDWEPPPMTIYALYPSRRNLSPAVRTLLDFLAERFATFKW